MRVAVPDLDPLSAAVEDALALHHALAHSTLPAPPTLQAALRPRGPVAPCVRLGEGEGSRVVGIEAQSSVVIRSRPEPQRPQVVCGNNILVIVARVFQGTLFTASFAAFIRKAVRCLSILAHCDVIAVHDVSLQLAGALQRGG